MVSREPGACCRWCVNRNNCTAPQRADRRPVKHIPPCRRRCRRPIGSAVSYACQPLHGWWRSQNRYIRIGSAA